MDVHKEAIDALKLGAEMSKEYYGKPLFVCYSGGKDSDALIQLCLDAGIDFECSHNLTTVDAPQTVYHVRETFAELENKGVKCSINHGEYKGERMTMWRLIPIKLMPPTRLVRYCCSVLKEGGGADRIKALGVRKSESTARKSRDAFEIIADKKANAARWDLETAHEVYTEAHELPEIYDCNLIAAMKRNGSTAVNPLINWSDRDVIDYLHDAKRKLNPLYNMGFSRVGCVMCPMGGARTMQKEAGLFPKYKRAYLHAFARMLEERKRRGLISQWKDANEVMHWWIDDGVIPNQIEMEL